MVLPRQKGVLFLFEQSATHSERDVSNGRCLLDQIDSDDRRWLTGENIESINVVLIVLLLENNSTYVSVII